MCADHHGRECPDYKPHRVTCRDCGRGYCSNLALGFQCRDCYLYDEYEAGLL